MQESSELAAPNHTAQKCSSAGTQASSYDMFIRSVGGSKLPWGLRVSVNGCMSDCVALWWAGDRFKVYPTSCPISAGIGTNSLWLWKGQELQIMDGSVAFNSYPIPLRELQKQTSESANLRQGSSHIAVTFISNGSMTELPSLYNSWPWKATPSTHKHVDIISSTVNDQEQ